MDPVAEHMACDLARPAPPGIEPLVQRLVQDLGDGLRAVVLYGSTRRNADIRDGLVDLMAVVSGYRAVHGPGIAALMNRLIPPNVYYLQVETQPRSVRPGDTDPDERIRCKYIIVSERDFARRTRRGLDGYFWARFTQPCRLVWTRDERTARFIAECRANAARRFARAAVGLGYAELDAEGFWTRAIQATYRCELRPEPPGAAKALVARDAPFWRRLSALLLPGTAGVESGADRYEIVPGPAIRIRGRLAWFARRYWSKTLNLARLLKAAGTFANGVDYLCWKLERHSGIRIEPTERMRRRPRLASWKLLIRLWRSGALG